MHQSEKIAMYQRFILVLFVMVLGLPAHGQVTDGLTGFYLFDGNALDSSIYGNNGILIGNATAQGMLNIPSDDLSYLSLPNNLLNQMDDFSIAFWVNFSEFNIGEGKYNTILSGFRSDKTGTDALGIYYRKSGTDNSGAWQLWIENDYCSVFTDTIRAGTWYFMVFGREGSTARIYRDGMLVTAEQGIWPYPLRIDPAGLVVGQEQDQTANYFDRWQCLNGSVGKLRFYYRCITANEVALLYQDPMGLPERGENSGLRVFPNPVQGPLNVDLSGHREQGLIRISDSMGRVIFNLQETGGKPVVLDLSSYPPGLYLVGSESEGRWYSRRIIKR
jgi:hypothetical protein